MVTFIHTLINFYHNSSIIIIFSILTHTVLFLTMTTTNLQTYTHLQGTETQKDIKHPKCTIPHNRSNIIYKNTCDSKIINKT